MATINHDALAQVEAELADGDELTVHHIGQVFGSDAYELIIELLLDANDAARAIQMAINRLRMGDDADSDDEDLDDE